MKSDVMLATGIKRLLSSLSEHGTRHLSEIETDLEQTDFLLSRAIEKLGSSFMAMHGAIAAQQETIDLLLSGAAPTSEMAAKLKAGREEIDRQVNAAITGLQFQDMTSQLIGRTMARLNGLREVLDRAGASGAGMPVETEMAGIISALGSINEALEERSGQLAATLSKAVSQTHMESGDIELF